MDRRAFLAAVPAVPLSLSRVEAVQGRNTSSAPTSTGRLKQGVALQDLLGPPERSLDDRCQDAVRLGIKGFDLIDDTSQWPTVMKHGLEISLYRVQPPRPAGAPPPAPGARGGGAPPGWVNAIARKEAMGDYLAGIHTAIDYAADHGVTNILLQCGSRAADLDYATGADNAVVFCNAIKSHAEQKKVVFQIEILNSKGQQAPRDSIFDHMAWGVDVVKRVNSPSVKILYDVFHAQLVEGNIVQTIRDNIQYIGHIHFGGVPGRHEIDETQELNYRLIATAIADLKFSGYVSHEWRPSAGADPVASLAKCMQIVNV